MPKYIPNKSLNFIADSKREVRRVSNYFQHDDRWDERKVTFKDVQGGGGGGGRGGGGGGGGGRVRKRNQQNNCYVAPSRLRFLDDDVDMGAGAPGPSGPRYAPYRGQGRKGRKGRLPPLPNSAYRGGPMHQGTLWHKVVLTHGGRHDKNYLLKTIQEMLSQPLQPLAYTREGAHAIFYLDTQSVAEEVRKCVKQVPTEEGFKINVHVTRCPPPNLPLNAEIQEKIRNVMSRRYNVQTHALDMKRFNRDEELVQDAYCPLNRPNVSQYVLQVIGEHIPEMEALDLSENRIFNLSHFAQLSKKAPQLKVLLLARNNLSDVSQLDGLASLPVEELSLDGNPLCSKFRDHSFYVKQVRKRFPKLLRLDGAELPPRIGFDVQDSTRLPPTQGSFFCSKDARGIILQFLEQYFTIYDSENRQPLLDAYHASSRFSMSVAYPPNHIASSNAKLDTYLMESRNLIKVPDDSRRQRRLMQGNLGIVSFLSQLPATQHDPTSFVVDVPHASPALILCCVSGVFKEIGSIEKYAPVRSFSRAFVLVPHGAGFCIVNEELFITIATVKQIKCAFKAPDPTPSPSPVPYVQAGESPAAVVPAVIAATSPVLPVESTKQQMMLSFSQQSGMNQEWSLKCLEENQWDFNRAAHVFSELQRDGKVPPEAFVK